MRKQVLGLLMVSFLTACGDKVVPRPPPPPPPPGASLSATGEGNLVVHPSINPAYAVALETPIRVSETAGGSANWNYARMALFMNGSEIERSELGSASIQAAGFGRINARSSQVYRLIFRFNSVEFDRVDITLGFGDVKDGREITLPVSLQTFDDVELDFTPASLRWSKLPM
jgi:hypothetical protein